MRDFLQDLREHWDDSYWWADHQILLAAVVGAVSLTFTLLEIYAKRRLLPPANG